MRSLFGAALAALIALAAGTSVTAPALAREKASVAVTAIVEHPALDAVREGVREALQTSGYVEGENLDFTYESAQGNPATAAQIARQFVGARPDVIVPIATPSAQAVVSTTRDIPVVFSAVTDPVSAGLVKDMETPGGNVTGVSDLSPVADHVALIRELTPEAKMVGFLYNPGEANSAAILDALRNAAEDAGLTVVESMATRSADVQAAARALVGEADVLYVPTDNTIVSALEAAVSVAEEADIPLYTADTDSVARGAIAAIGFNYYDVGIQTGEIVVRILKGEDPGAIPVEMAQGTDLVINPHAAEAMGVTIPDTVIDRASQVTE